jgi:hypothetical protein
MSKPTSTDYENEPPTQVETTPLPTRYDRGTRQLLLCDDEPTEREGATRT